MVEEKVFADSIKKCYTYDSVGRVIETVVKNISDDSAIEKETFNYDAAGNITDAPNSCFQYDTNNRVVVFDGNQVSYDLDGNMLSEGVRCFTYDSTNKLITADGHTYTYNAEGVRIRNLCECGEETTYTYNTNCKLSQLLMKTTDGVVTKYVYGKGLIGEEVDNAFKTYHFDFRGSTIAITDASGAIMDTFAYDTYGKCISRTGTSDVIFGYNGRDGVVTDSNGLIYMRARYYSPEMKRFINADIVAGSITNAVTLNRFAYANGNPVSLVDPFGLSAERSLLINEISKYSGNWEKAILVTHHTLPVVGHSEIFFMNEDNEWIWVEFNLEGYSGLDLVKNKHKACVSLKDVNHPLYSDFFDGEFSYVELTGNFNKSVKLACYYAQNDNKDFGGYNLFVNNCADFTDCLLEVADVDGMFSKIMIEEDDFVSIPRVRELKTSAASLLDSGIYNVVKGLENSGKEIKRYDFIGSDLAGNVLIGTGNMIDKGTDWVGDFVGDAIGIYNDGMAPIKDLVGIGVKKVWEMISPWQ
ncbi:MAG: RHS repeat-associated core domain-containing protein [Clostridia bacterium]|nr:RHS repeat-associated core domain-containing protein [Clostridia bacterium]